MRSPQGLGGRPATSLEREPAEMKTGSIALVALGFAGVATVTGCATMVRGTSQDVTIDTDPPGAVATLSDGRSCVTPCVLEAERKRALRVTLEKRDCDPQSATMMPTSAGPWALVSGLIDRRTGAAYDLQPNPLLVELTCRARPLFPA